jgi:hypothetical protein
MHTVLEFILDFFYFGVWFGEIGVEIMDGELVDGKGEIGR